MINLSVEKLLPISLNPIITAYSNLGTLLSRFKVASAMNKNKDQELER
jgi:hypothetical protein